MSKIDKCELLFLEKMKLVLYTCLTLNVVKYFNLMDLDKALV